MPLTINSDKFIKEQARETDTGDRGRLYFGYSVMDIIVGGLLRGYLETGSTVTMVPSKHRGGPCV